MHRDVTVHACLFSPNTIDRLVVQAFGIFFACEEKNHGSETKYSRNVNLRSHMCSEVTKTAFGKDAMQEPRQKAKANTCFEVMNAVSAAQVANSTAK